MNRTLRRPMFRIGGKAEGITSGLDAPELGKRQNFENGNTDLESRYNRAMDFIKSQKADRQSDFNNFLISTGLDLVSRPRSGNIFQQVATSAKQPFETFTAAKSSAADADDKLSQALIGDIMEQMSEEDIARIEGEYDVKKEQAKPDEHQSRLPNDTLANKEKQLGDMLGDAPLCDQCGHTTVRNGSCYKCLNCGNSMGCS